MDIEVKNNKLAELQKALNAYRKLSKKECEILDFLIFHTNGKFEFLGTGTQLFKSINNLIGVKEETLSKNYYTGLNKLIKKQIVIKTEFSIKLKENYPDCLIENMM